MSYNESLAEELIETTTEMPEKFINATCNSAKLLECVSNLCRCINYTKKYVIFCFCKVYRKSYYLLIVSYSQ